jgi:hypothetical protein
MSNLLSAPLTWIMGEGEEGGRGGVGRPVPPPKLVKLMLEREVGAPAGIPASVVVFVPAVPFEQEVDV